MMTKHLMAACIGVCLLAWPLLAKRIAPKPVPPILSGGVRYSVVGDGSDQYVTAVVEKSGVALWKVKVFHNSIDARWEEDVQWVFIKKLQLSGHSLQVKDEINRCHAVDVTTKHVKNVRCSF